MKINMLEVRIRIGLLSWLMGRVMEVGLREDINYGMCVMCIVLRFTFDWACGGVGCRVRRRVII